MTAANDESCLVNLAHGAGDVLEETLYAEPREWNYVQGTFVFMAC